MVKVRIEGRFGRRADSTDMLKELGVKKLPREAMPERLIQGVRVYVKAYERTHPRHTSTHRVMAICNCGQHVPTGRLHQHKCKEGQNGN